MSKMPVLFVGHGSPMNAIENNEFTRSWESLGQSLPRPACIVSVSAHWYTQGTRVMDAKNPRTIYDMYGFPDALYRVVYAAQGAPETARRAATMLTPPAETDNSWGIDHGTWSVLCRMYPTADIPVFQLSVNARASMEEHEAIGRSLRALRDEGALIMGSGNVVHNLARVDWHTPGGFQWAGEFDGTSSAPFWKAGGMMCCIMSGRAKPPPWPSPCPITMPRCSMPWARPMSMTASGYSTRPACWAACP